MAIDPEVGGRRSVFRNRRLVTLMLGHLTIDSFAGLLPVLFPLLIARYDLDYKTVGLLSLAYTGIASLVQPVFGWIADRYGTRFIGLSLIWTAVAFAGIGFAPTFPLLLLLAGAAGIGSGAYHPFGALNASAVIHERQRNTAMSVYVTAGTVGFALGPVIGTAIFAALDLRGTLLMVLPGCAIAYWMLRDMRSLPQQQKEQARPEPAVHSPVPLLPLLIIVGIMMSRTWTVFSVQAYIPSWYQSLGYSQALYGPLTTTFILAGAAGTVLCGALADRYGRRAVILGTLLLSIPALLLFAEFTGPVGFALAAFLGFSAGSTAPLLLVMAQQLLSTRAGVASGLILGVGFVAGAIGVPITGAIADSFGMETAIRAQVALVVATIALTALMPGEAYLQARSRQVTKAQRA